MYTILLVDDDPGVRKSVGDMLERSGYGVLRAEDGRFALAALQGPGTVDLVIAGHRMPGLDGLALVRRIREAAPRLPVVIMTAHGDLQTYLCAIGLGVIRYIRMPFGLHELQQAVRDAVSGGACEKTLKTERAGRP